MKQATNIRLYVDTPLAEGQEIVLTQDQAHYLFVVMRQAQGAVIRTFNGRDGEWRAQVTQAGKRNGRLLCAEQSAPQQNPPDLWLCFAPIKKARTDFIVEKATELGAARVQPVITEFTNAEKVRLARLQAHAQEAAEQCGGTYVPQDHEPVKLRNILRDWPKERALIFCYEARAGSQSAARANQAPKLPPAPVAILIGPEGGFSQTERRAIEQ